MQKHIFFHLMAYRHAGRADSRRRLEQQSQAERRQGGARGRGRGGYAGPIVQVVPLPLSLVDLFFKILVKCRSNHVKYRKNSNDNI
jgi:hypothetical protein